MIGIVIPSYERPEFLLKCLTNISEVALGIDKIAYIVLNNDSDKFRDNRKTDMIDISNSFRFTKVVITPFNNGVGVARRAGSKVAIFDGCKYIINTDDDCKFNDKTFTSVIDILDNNKDIGLVSSSSGGMLSVFNHGKGEGEDFFEAPTATGTFAASRASLLNRIGNYDPNLPMKEDIEICYRIWIYGSRCAVATKCKLSHTGHRPGGLQSTKIRDDKEDVINKYIMDKYPNIVKVNKIGSWNWWRQFKKMTPGEIKELIKKLDKIDYDSNYPRRIRVK